ncbi:MAG: HEAT repeat domain-containing protein [Nocardioidaceae bacterium]
MKEVAQHLLQVFGALATLLVVLLVLLRVVRKVLRRRRETRAHELRGLLLTALLGEPGEQQVAGDELRGRRGRAWVKVEAQAFALLPKIKGDSRSALVELLLSRGAEGHAAADARSWSQVRRARGAYRLGSLEQPASAPMLAGLLHDRHFLVRRSAVRALGQVGDATYADALLDAVVADHTLTRDAVAALVRLGPAAAPVLSHALADGLVNGDDEHRLTLAARGLGLLGDVVSTTVLVDALSREAYPHLRVAAAEALGLIGSPEAVQPLVRTLYEEDAALRVAVADALGAVSDPSGVPGLAMVLDLNTHEASRAVASALLRLGEPGLRVLGASESPYAAEALAVQRVRQTA